MRIVHLSTYDTLGGAAIAARRLHLALRDGGVDSRMLVRQRRSDDPSVALPGGPGWRPWLRLQRRLDRLRLWRVPPAAHGFSVGWVPGPAIGVVRALRPDVVHAHWVADGFVRPEALAGAPGPLVWTLHDLWPFTGGCHFPGRCARFEDRCGDCPLLGARAETDLSRAGWRRRRDLFAARRVAFVAPSRWMADQARRSSLLATADVRVIPYGIDPRRFAPAEAAATRAQLGLRGDKLVLLAGAVDFGGDARKGAGHLAAALDRLCATGWRDRIEVVVFGGFHSLGGEWHGFPIRSLGPQPEPALARVYAAADLFVLPSIEDNLPNTAIEAMATGTPVVGHAVGGMPEIVDHGGNGLLVDWRQEGALADAIASALADPGRLARWRHAARDKVVRCFQAEKIASAHLQLYVELRDR